MTEQEQIEEMASIIMQEKPCEALAISECIKRKCKYPHYSGVTCIAEHQAEALYNAGYKQEKEVAKEILQDLLNYCALYGCVSQSDILAKAEKYGIELE